ncbi:MAG: protease modulator HflK, partial [Pseudomonadota bacterium]
MASNNGGPWGGGPRGGGSNGGGDNRGGGRRPGGDGPQIPEIDEIMKKGQEQLRVLMGGRGSGRNGGDGPGPGLSRGTIIFGLVAAVGLWAFSSFYTVRPEEQSVELFLGEFSAVGNPGLNFAPWPLVTYEVIPVTREQSEDIGTGRSGSSGGDGLMLTTDENIVDIDFQVVWNINDPAMFLFNLRDPRETVRAVSEAAMREIIAGSELAPILNRDRGLIESTAQELIQSTLNSYQSGINIVRVNLDRSDPPSEVIDAFREVQAAEQERDRLERTADAYANRVL